MSDCTLVILTYKGRHHLEHLLPTVKDAIKNYRGQSRIGVLIVDNGCDEPTREYVNQNFPEYDFRFSPVNDYLFSLNGFVADIKDEYVFILNDDTRLDKEILNNLIPVMDNDDTLFAVTCRFLDWDTGASASGVRIVGCEKGWMNHWYLNLEEREAKYTLYASGGGSLFRTRIFNELNGFDNLFRPGYSEDTDVSIRGWQSGFKILYLPDAYLYHREGGTMENYYRDDKRARIIYRNQILWMLKNARTKGFLFWFFAMLPYRILYNRIKHPIQYKAFISAIPLMRKALSRRRSFKPAVNDEVWLAYIDTPYSVN